MSFTLLEQVYKDVVLPTTEKALLAFLAFRANNDGTSIYPGLDSMMTALNLKKWQTLKLLRLLKEKGYIIQVSHPGPRHLAVYCIPLNAAGMICPQPIPPEELAAQKEKRKRKKTVQEVAALAEISPQMQELAEEPSTLPPEATSIPEIPPPSDEMEAAPADYCDGSPRSPILQMEEFSPNQLSLAQQKVIFYERRVRETGGGAISMRMLQHARLELALLQQQLQGQGQGDFIT